MEVRLPNTKMTVHARYGEGKPVEHLVYEGEVLMTQQQQDAYKSLIGDGHGRVSVSRDMGEKDFGSGGGIMVTVSLTCDQSEPVVNAAIQMAYNIADQAVKYYHPQIKQDLINRGILKP